MEDAHNGELDDPDDEAHEDEEPSDYSHQELLDKIGWICEPVADQLMDDDEQLTAINDRIHQFEIAFHQGVLPMIEELAKDPHIEITTIDTSAKSISTYVHFFFTGTLEDADNSALLDFDTNSEELLADKITDHDPIEARISDHESGHRVDDYAFGGRIDYDSGDVQYIF